MNKQRRRLQAATIGMAVLASVAVLSGCGSSSDDAASDTSTVETAALDTTAADTAAADTESADTEAVDTEAAGDTAAFDTDVDGTEAPGEPILGVQTMGVYDCGALPDDPDTHTFLRFGDDGSFFAVSAQATVDDVRPWLGMDTTKVAPGTFTAEGSTFTADTDPGDAPGVLWDGGFADDGSIAASTHSEINNSDANQRCFFSAD